MWSHRLLCSFNMNILNIFLLAVCFCSETGIKCGEELKKENLLRQPALCKNVSAACLKSMAGDGGAKNLGLLCISAFTSDTLKELSGQTAAQILQSDSILDIPCKPEILAALLKNSKFAKYSITNFLVEAARNPEYSAAIISGLLPESGAADILTAAKFFIPETAPYHSVACKAISADLISIIRPDFFARMTGECLKQIPLNSLKVVDGDLLKYFNPVALRDLSLAQAQSLRTAALLKLTPNQILNFGPDPPALSPNFKDLPTGEPRQAAVKTALTAANHPCLVFQPIIEKGFRFGKDQVKPLKDHCYLGMETKKMSIFEWFFNIFQSKKK